MTAGITRVNGWAKPGSFYGYQTRFFTVAGAGFYTDAGTGYTNYVANSPFEKAIRNGIEQFASVTIVGTPTSAGFTVAIDGDNYYGRDDHTGYAGDSSTATITAAVYAASGVYPQVTEVVLSGTGFAAGTVADYDNI
jgi:hypothetical protein